MDRGEKCQALLASRPIKDSSPGYIKHEEPSRRFELFLCTFKISSRLNFSMFEL